MACTANFMKALTVLDSLKNMPCQEGNVTVLTRLAYDMVSAEPQSSVSVLAGRVATAATQQGLIMAAPAGSFTIQQLQNVQQQLQPMQRTSQRPQGPPPHVLALWRRRTHGRYLHGRREPLQPLPLQAQQGLTSCVLLSSAVRP